MYIYLHKKNTFKFIYLLLSILFFMFTSCKKDKNIQDEFSIQLADSTESFRLNDSNSPLGLIDGIELLSKNRLIASDITPAIYLFNNYEMVSNYGRPGKGPCEFEQITVFDILDDTLYVLDHPNNKIIYFDIETQKCLGEISHKSLQGVSQLYREKTSSSYILGLTHYFPFTPDSTPVLYRLFDDKTVEALNLNLGRINPVNSSITIGNKTNFQKYKTKLFSYFSMTDSLYAIDLHDQSITSFDMGIDLHRSELEEAGKVYAKLAKIITEELNTISQFFILDEFIIVQYIDQNGNEEMRKIKFFTHGGKFIKEIQAKAKVVAVINNQLVELYSEGNADDFQYSIRFRNFWVDGDIQ